MKLLKMDKPMCLIYSAAMILNITPEAVVEAIGHDGLEQIHPDTKAYTGVHIQEIIDLVMSYGYHGLVPIDGRPYITPNPNITPKLIWPEKRCDERFLDRIDCKKGILIGEVHGGHRHACAWDGSRVYDPRGRVYELFEDDFQIAQCWLLI